MEQERELLDYRARLLDGLKVGTRRSACGSSDPMQVFVNDRRVGFLQGGGTEAILQLQSHARIDNVQLRSEDGVLLGGLSAPEYEYGFRVARISLSRDAVELRIHNTAQGGSVCAVFIPAPRRWHQIWRAIAGSARAVVPRPSGEAIAHGMRIVAFTQAVMAIIVLGLAADRITAWMTLERTTLAEVAKLEQQLGDLARMQAKAVDTIQSQQRGMAQLQVAIAKLTSTQETVASSILTVRQEMGKRQKSSGGEIKRMTRLLMSKAQADQKQLEAKIHGLMAANERLSEELAGLEQHNLHLEKKLKSAGVDVSKATVSDREEPMIAKPPEASQPPSPPLAEGLAKIQSQPLLFWVTFGEETSQEIIDEWVRELPGKKGSLSEGWQEVQVPRPSLPPDQFLEQIREAKIVKAVRISQ